MSAGGHGTFYHVVTFVMQVIRVFRVMRRQAFEIGYQAGKKILEKKRD